MKTKKTSFKMLLWAALMLPLFLILQPQDVQASHFRYGHLTWQPVSGNTVRFTLTDAFRRDGFGGSAPDGFVAVGDVFTENIGFYGVRGLAAAGGHRLIRSTAGHIGPMPVTWTLARAETSSTR